VITCDEFMSDLGNYLEGEAAAEVRRQIENHLAHCRTCQVIYDSTRKTVRLVTDSDSFALPDEAAKQIVARIMARARENAES
jgi:predicted anti-sigma-YlaC factor YlaD